MKVIFGVLLLLLAFFVIGIAATTESTSAAPGSAVVTRDEYLEIDEGMTYSQVTNIVGGDGGESSSSEFPGISTVAYTWQGERPGSNMMLIFQNNALVTKAQYGLQ